jgi:soluble lytic murein transglycosylase-like protein
MKSYHKPALYGALALIATPTSLALAGLVLPTHTPTPCHTAQQVPGVTKLIPNSSPITNLSELADSAADKHGIPRDIFAALVQQESAWQESAVSAVGAVGLAQIMPRTGEHHCGLSPDELTNPALNLDCGASYLAAQFHVFRDWRLALAGYNAGPSRVIQAGGIPAIVETENYVKTICGAADCGGAA